MIDRSIAVHDAANEAERDAAREACWEQNRVQVCQGPPGTGKTTFLFLAIEHCLAKGGRVFFLTPTAQLASRMREKFGNRIEIETCHAGLGLGRPAQESAYVMAPYDLVCIDEMGC